MPLARQLARRYQRVNEPLDDLIQVASLGLVKAVDRFDIARGVAFSSYAVPTILGELKRHFRDAGWAVHVPRGTQERAMQVDRAVKELSGRQGRSPSVAEVAEHAGLSVEEALSAMEAGQAYEAVSLDAQRSTDGESDTFADSIGAEDERFELIEYQATIAPDAQGAAQARSAGAAPALRRGPDAVADRRARRRLPDAGVEADPPRAGPPAHGGRGAPGDGPLGQALHLVLAQEALEQAPVALLVVEDRDHHVVGDGIARPRSPR